MFKIDKLDKSTTRKVFDVATLLIMIAALVGLLALIYYQVRPIQTLDIKVPVSTDKPEYAPGDEVSGIFFGEVFYSGKVEILREVFCRNYQGVIKADNGQDIFSTVSIPITLEGASRRIGKLPMDVPVGENCVIQFINTYTIGTPFGTRVITEDYYTQNFLIAADPTAGTTRLTRHAVQPAWYWLLASA